jgi:hypothetical protein
MKNLVLSSLVAAIALQSTACILVDDDDDVPLDANRIAVTWNYKINNQIQSGCPAGVVGVDLKIKSLDSGREDIYQYDCADKVLIEYVDDGDYQIWVELINGNNTVYAQSLSVIYDLFEEDLDITTDIHEDKGFFSLQWTLKGASSNANLACNQVPGLSKIGLLATKVGTADGTDSLFDCPPGIGVSLALDTGLYTLDADAVNSSNQSLGSTDVATNQPIGSRNDVTPLTVVIPITGL